MCFLTCLCPGEASGCDMGEIRRILQQEEHHNVWWHRTKLPHESTERTEGSRPASPSLCWECSLPHHCQLCAHMLLKLVLCVSVFDRSGPSWRLISTGRRTGSCINWLSTSKKLPSLRTSVDSTTNTGKGTHTCLTMIRTTAKWKKMIQTYQPTCEHQHMWDYLLFLCLI